MNMAMNMNYNQMNPQQNYYLNQPQTMNKNQQPSADNILFVADLPDEASEEDLANFFKSYNFLFAKILHNVMKTHAFVHFESKEAADRARLELNGVKITAKYSNNKVSKPVRLCKYETKQNQEVTRGEDTRTNLLIKNISKDVSAHSFWNTFRACGDIRSAKLVVDFLGNSKGFGYINYYRAEDAERARQELNDKEINGKVMKVTFLESGRRVEKRRNNIYVKHLPKENYTDEDLKKLFEEFGTINSAVTVKDQDGVCKGFGFVCFEKSEDAEEAYKSMNNKTAFKDIPPLYVNFAMKKGERQELLMKKREEMYKMAQKMTLFVKIKEEDSVKNEEDFNQQIRHYLRTVLGKEYEPRSIKTKFDTKNAFITMNTQRDAEEFIRKFQEYSKDNETNLFFNLYKSKQERISTNAYFKKYNQLEGDQMNKYQQKMYKTYNDLPGQQPNEFPYSTVNQDMSQQGMPKKQQMYKSYNQFDDENMMQQPMRQMNQMNLNQMSQMNQMNQPQFNAPIQQNKPNDLGLMDPDEIGDFIFSMAERLYPTEAPKITGMIMELDIIKLRNLISSKKGLDELTNIVHQAYKQILQMDKNKK